MKKTIFSLAFAFALASFTSCGNATNGATSNADTVDTTVVDTVDSATVSNDSVCAM